MKYNILDGFTSEVIIKYYNVTVLLIKRMKNKLETDLIIKHVLCNKMRALEILNTLKVI